MINFDDILKEFKVAYKQHIDESGHKASGNLGNSMTFETQLNSNGYIITLTLPEYAIYLENGTKPHWPNVDAIKKWIKIKPILPRPINGKLPTENQLAYLIGRKISKVGTKPTHLIEDTMTDFQLINKLYNRIAESLSEEIKNTVNETLTK